MTLTLTSNRQEISDGVLTSHLELSSSEITSPVSVVQLSDFHAGPITPFNKIAKVVSLASNLDPDLVFLTGDFLQISNTGFRYKFKIGQKSRLGIPKLCQKLNSAFSCFNKETKVFACLGNHDHLDGASDVVDLLSASCEFLVNQSVDVNINAAKLSISGIDDFQRGEPKLKDTSESVDQTSHLRLLLSHNPDVVLSDEASALDVYQMIFCGHTHGGQIRIPHLPPLATRTTQKKHVQGLSKHKQSYIYVTNGVGYGGIPLRLFCPAEIVHVVFKPADN